MCCSSVPHVLHDPYFFFLSMKLFCGIVVAVAVVNRELGTLRSATGTVDENVTSKYNLALSKVFRDYSVSFTSYNMGEVS